MNLQGVEKAKPEPKLKQGPSPIQVSIIVIACFIVQLAVCLL